jgi:hypothetical protein
MCLSHFITEFDPFREKGVIFWVIGRRSTNEPHTNLVTFNVLRIYRFYTRVKCSFCFCYFKRVLSHEPRFYQLQP